MRLPAILPLLLLGMAAGPFGLGLIQPAALGGGLEVLVHLGVAIILFEGSLSLDPRTLRSVGAPVARLLTIGVAATWIGAAVLAHAVGGVSWQTAALFGAVVSVTGPTVVVPLLRHMVAPRRLRDVLVSEGLIVDPIGAVLAYLVLQWIERSHHGAGPLLREVAMLGAVGAVVGFLAGVLVRTAARTRFVAGELRNPAILALLLGAYLTADHLAPQSGVLAAVVMGITVAAGDVPDLGKVKGFKEQLTLLFLSVLFVMLSARLDLAAMIALAGPGLVVAAGLTLLVRPIAVALSVLPRHLDGRSRLVLALTAPRGIVAAAVASLSALALERAGLGAEGAVLEALVYLAILATGAWATLMVLALPPLLGFAADPSRRRIVLVGAHELSAAIADHFRRRGRTVVVVDGARRKLAELAGRGIETVRGDARDAATYEAAGVERDTDVLALTVNDELNVLAAELVREEFGVKHPVVALQRPSDEFGTVRQAWIDTLGGPLGLDLPRWIRELEAGRATIAEVEGSRAAALSPELLEDRQNLLFLCAWTGGQPSFRRPGVDLGRFERLAWLATPAAASALGAAARE